MTLSLPRQLARTRFFTLGTPRSFTVSPDGDRVYFLRSRHGHDPVTSLWVHEDGAERLLVDPHELGLPAEEDVPAAERVRRERARETGSGITAYTTDAAVTVASVALSGRVWLADLATGTATRLPTVGAATDPRPDPTGNRVAYLGDGATRLVGVDGTGAETWGPRTCRAGRTWPRTCRGSRSTSSGGRWTREKGRGGNVVPTGPAPVRP